MPPDSETPVAVKDQLPSGPLRRAPAGWQRFGRPALVLAACLLLAYGGYYAWRTWFGRDPANVSVVTAVAQRGNLEDAITATGMLQPKDFVDVGTQVSGQLKTLLVDVGAVVKAKQLLAEIDPSVHQLKSTVTRHNCQTRRRSSPRRRHSSRLPSCSSPANKTSCARKRLPRTRCKLPRRHRNRRLPR